MTLGFIGTTSPALVDHYVDLLALGWKRRPRQLCLPGSVFADLEFYDDALVGAGEALCVLRSLGSEVDRHVSGMLREPLRSHEVFALVVHAIDAENEGLLDSCRDLSGVLPGLAVAFDAALSWARPSTFWRQVVRRLPVTRRLTLAGLRCRDDRAFAAETIDGALTDSIDDQEIAAALQSKSQCGLFSGGDASLLGHKSSSVRLRAAEAASLFEAGADPNLRARAAQVLQELVSIDRSDGSADALRRSALRGLCLHHPDVARGVVSILAKTPTRLGFEALGWVGSVQAVPFLIGATKRPEWARLAASAVMAICGTDPDRDAWRALPNASRDSIDDRSEAIPELDLDADLPWPDAGRLAAWWSRDAGRFDVGARYVAGRPLDEPGLLDVLSHGPLPCRPVAAEHLQRVAGGMWFRTAAPANSQRAWLQGSGSQPVVPLQAGSP